MTSRGFKVTSLSGTKETLHFEKAFESFGFNENVTGFLLRLMMGTVFVTSPPTDTIPKSRKA